MHNAIDRLANLPPEQQQRLRDKLVELQKQVAPPTLDEGIVTGPVPLLPGQQRMLDMMAKQHMNHHHFNVAALLTVLEPINPDLMRQVVAYLLRYHDALRLRVSREPAGWRQYIIAPDNEVPFQVIDLSAVDEAQLSAAIEQEAAALQQSLNLEHGPIMRVALFDLGPLRPGRLLVIVHHQAMDAFSLRILLEDLLMAYQQLLKGAAIHLPAKTTSVKTLAERILAYGESLALREECDYWLQLPWSELAPPRADHPEGTVRAPQVESVKVVLSPEETQVFTQMVTRLEGGQMKNLLLAALAQVMVRWTGSQVVQFVVLFNGRKVIFDDIDLSRTIGWLTIQPSVVLRIPENSAPQQVLSAVMQQLQQVPSEGLGFELLRESFQDSVVYNKFGKFPNTNIVFNYLGQHLTSPMFPVAAESYGPLSPFSDLSLWRSDLHMIFAEIVDYRLSIQWDYSTTMFERQTIEHIVQEWLATLHTMIERNENSL